MFPFCFFSNPVGCLRYPCWSSWLQDGITQAMQNQMSFSTVKAILFAAKAMPFGGWAS
jgi:hypothetical protein